MAHLVVAGIVQWCCETSNDVTRHSWLSLPVTWQLRSSCHLQLLGAIHCWRFLSLLLIDTPWPAAFSLPHGQTFKHNQALGLCEREAMKLNCTNATTQRCKIMTKKKINYYYMHVYKSHKTFFSKLSLFPLFASCVYSRFMAFLLGNFVLNTCLNVRNRIMWH